MPKLLPDSDFRSKRRVLTRADFAVAPGRGRAPSDLIDRATWNSIVVLPDDVAIRTSNHHGTVLRQLDGLWGAWIESVGDKQDILFSAMLDAGDNFQSATYTALTGFYRLSVDALRGALELMVIATWAQVCRQDKKFQKWSKGSLVLSFGQACDGLISDNEPLRTHLRSVVNDTLFDPKDLSTQGGFARRIYSGVSDFSHARPGYADADMRASNGPIYVTSAFEHVSWIQFEVIGLCYVLALIARPKLVIPEAVVKLFDNVTQLKSRVSRAAFEALRGTSRTKALRIGRGG